jgi:hypothetical protein
VLQYRAAGETEADVAKWLGVGVQAVRAEAKAAYGSLGAATREALLARWAARESAGSAIAMPMQPQSRRDAEAAAQEWWQ